MRNYVCWAPDRVREVINPFAEHIPDGLFRAVHSDWDLEVTPPVGTSFQQIGEAAWTRFTPADFLQDFLREDRPHSLAVILGNTGSGKSHLVHWMRLHVREDASRMVLVVRKSGTSLRAIVREIIERLPPEEQRNFLEIFESAGDGTTTREGRKHELLNHLAQAIRDDTPGRGASEFEEALLEALPHLLQDSYMRKEHFLRDGGVVGEIVDHIFADSNAKDRPDRRRVFTAKDLSFGGMDFVHAAKLARDAIQILEVASAETFPAAIGIINRNLDRAVARTLSFSGDRVEELMTRLRTHLKATGRELLLLVEEFARLQGIDRALLQAMTSQGDERLCRMRTALAVTTGFFASVAETAYMRTTHIVDMDRSSGRAQGDFVSRRSLAEFTARYLNAVRLGRDRIQAWSGSAEPGDAAPSRCVECVHVATCHATFGQSDGYGLYPFTEQALWNAASRMDPALPKALNPRILQNDVLVEVLDNCAPAISAGQYPPARLLQKLDGVRGLSLADQTTLTRRDPQEAERWMALLEIYDGAGRIVNLPVELREAFSVPAIPEAAEGRPEPHDHLPPVPAAMPVPAKSADDIAIEAWIRGGLLDQRIASRLREPIFSAVVDAIDWDMLGIASSSVAGKGGRAFQQRNIGFVRQSTGAGGYVQIPLEVDADPRTGLALQGLLTAGRNQFRWDFEGGDRALAAFLDCVERWSGDVSARIRVLGTGEGGWDRASAALHLLCVGAAVGGRVKPDATAADLIDAAFGNWPEEAAASSPRLRTVYARIRRRREDLATASRARMSSMKGGRAGSMLDARKVVPVVRVLRGAKWRLSLPAPEADRDDITMLYREVAQELTGAAEEERTLRATWLQEVEEAFGGGSNRAAIVAALASARDAIFEAGFPAQSTLRPFADALERFQAVQFDDTILAARAVAHAEDAVAMLPHFGRGRANAVSAASDLRVTATKFLASVEQSLHAYGEDQAAGTRDVEASVAAIDSALVSIIEGLDGMNGQVGMADAA